MRCDKCGDRKRLPAQDPSPTSLRSRDVQSVSGGRRRERSKISGVREHSGEEQASLAPAARDIASLSLVGCHCCTCNCTCTCSAERAQRLPGSVPSSESPCQKPSKRGKEGPRSSIQLSSFQDCCSSAPPSPGHVLFPLIAQAAWDHGGPFTAGAGFADAVRKPASLRNAQPTFSPTKGNLVRQSEFHRQTQNAKATDHGRWSSNLNQVLPLLCRAPTLPVAAAKLLLSRSSSLPASSHAVQLIQLL